MRRITLWLFSTIAALVLLFSYRTSTTGSGSGPAIAAAPATRHPTTTPPSTAPRHGSPSKQPPAAKTYTGDTAATRWGDVQVAITVTNGKITAVKVPVHPHENGRDREINAQALPILVQETLAAQSANIDAVSGATVTSNGYLQSLQSALDAAHLS